MVTLNARNIKMPCPDAYCGHSSLLLAQDVLRLTQILKVECHRRTATQCQDCTYMDGGANPFVNEDVWHDEGVSIKKSENCWQRLGVRNDEVIFSRADMNGCDLF